MSNLNKIFLMGRLTRDPELRYTPQGVPVSDLGLAVNREYSVQGGERRKDTLFIDVTVWRRQAELCCQYLRKGSPIFIEGRLSMDSWEGQDGQKRVRYRVVADNFQFIGGGSGGAGGGGGARRDDVGDDFGYGSPGGGGGDTGDDYGPPPETNYGNNYRGARPAPEGRPASGSAGAGGDYPSSVADEDIPF